MTGVAKMISLTQVGAALAALACGRTPGPEPVSLSRLGAGIAFFEARVARDPLDGVSAARLVGRYIARFHLSADLGDLGRGEAAAQRALGLDPDRSEGWARLSGIQLMQHKFQEAAASADSALAADSTSQSAIGAAFDVALATGHYGQASNLLRRLPPRATGALVRVAQWHDALGRGDAASSAMDQVCRALDRALAPATTRAWCATEQARIETRRRGAGAARALYRRALGHQPGYRAAVEGLAGLDAEAGNARSALRRYRAIAGDAHPDLYLRLAEQATILGHQGEAAAAEARFRAVALQPDREPLHGPEIVRYWLARGAPDSALAVARRELARRPTVESRVLAAEAAGRVRHR